MIEFPFRPSTHFPAVIPARPPGNLTLAATEPPEQAPFTAGYSSNIIDFGRKVNEFPGRGHTLRLRSARRLLQGGRGSPLFQAQIVSKLAWSQVGFRTAATVMPGGAALFILVPPQSGPISLSLSDKVYRKKQHYAEKNLYKRLVLDLKKCPLVAGFEVPADSLTQKHGLKARATRFLFLSISH